MAIYDIEIKTSSGRTLGWKVVRASSPAYIRANPSRYIGPERRIGRIVATDFTNTDMAMKQIQKDEGWMVKNQTRVPRKSKSIFDMYNL